MIGNDAISDAENPAATFEMTGVSFTVAEKRIIRDVTLRASERRIGIVGRNASGKTTLARLLSGLVAPTEGQITVRGADMACDRKAAIRTVGVLFQNPDHQIIFPTVEEELGFGLRQMGMSKSETDRQVEKTLREFDKQHWAGAATHQLSQGQKQLVCLMSIIAMAPKVVILDEPFSGLDLPTRAQLARYLDRTTAALIHISHEPANLQSYERVIWLEEGQVRMDGPSVPTLTAFMQEMDKLGGSDDISDLAG